MTHAEVDAAASQVVVFWHSRERTPLVLDRIDVECATAIVEAVIAHGVVCYTVKPSFDMGGLKALMAVVRNLDDAAFEAVGGYSGFELRMRWPDRALADGEDSSDAGSEFANSDGDDEEEVLGVPEALEVPDTDGETTGTTK